jgi:hypothetical protein
MVPTQHWYSLFHLIFLLKANPSFGGTSTNHLTKIQGKVDSI